MARLAVAIAVLFSSCAVTTPTAVTGPVTPQAIAPAPGQLTYFIGGDSRGDEGGVLPWAFSEARRAGATAFIFLGDMEWSASCDGRFRAEVLAQLAPVPFYPVLGNHEILLFGFLKETARDRAGNEQAFQQHFLDSLQTPVRSRFLDRVAYSVDLPGGLHFIALDNVSAAGFGAAQLAWLRDDLAAAQGRAGRPRARFIVVGMHKPLAGSCVGGHSMAEDGSGSEKDSEEALALLADPSRPVDLIVASHVHNLSRFSQRGIPTYVTGGLGAHLKKCECGDCRAFHHVLQLDVPLEGHGDKLAVRAIAFPGNSVHAATDADDDGQIFPDLRCGK